MDLDFKNGMTIECIRGNLKMISRKVMDSTHGETVEGIKGGGTMTNSMDQVYILQVIVKVKNMEFGVWANEFNGLHLNKLSKLYLKNQITSNCFIQRNQRIRMMRDLHINKYLRNMRNWKNLAKQN